MALSTGDDDEPMHGSVVGGHGHGAVGADVRSVGGGVSAAAGGRADGGEDTVVDGFGAMADVGSVVSTGTTAPSFATSAIVTDSTNPGQASRILSVASSHVSGDRDASASAARSTGSHAGNGVFSVDFGSGGGVEPSTAAVVSPSGSIVDGTGTGAATCAARVAAI